MTEMPETIYADVGESIYREGSWSRTEELAHKYTHVEKLIARIEAMKREPGADNCSGMRISKTLAPECKIWNAALSAVIDMLGSGKEKTMTKKAALIKAREWLDASDRSARTILDGGQCTEEFRKLFTGNLAVYETIRDLLDKAIGGEDGK